MEIITNTEKTTKTIKCCNCDKEIKETYIIEYEGDSYCLDCYLRDRYLLLDYMYKPRPKFCKMSYEKNPLFMGIELEVEGDFNDQNSYYDEDTEENCPSGLSEYAYNIMRAYPCYIKYDGSLNGSGMEIVSHPLTVKYHKRIFDWKSLLKRLKGDKFTSHSNNRCGIHIHLSKSWFKPEDFLKFNIIFDKNFSVIKRFSKRTTLSYCHKIRPYETQEITRLKKKTRLADWYDHYKSVYFGNNHTIEIRIYRGTLEIDQFNAILDMTEALSYFVKSYSLAFFIKSTKRQLWYTFLGFMKQSKK